MVVSWLINGVDGWVLCCRHVLALGWGLGHTAEVGLLSFLQKSVKHEFRLSGAQESLLSSCVFGGQLVGTAILGPMADRLGRKTSSIVSAVLIATMGIISAFSVNFAMLVICRSLVGFGIGGLAIVFSILAEFTPPQKRGRILIGIEFAWYAWLPVDVQRAP
jgi:MFS transporter, putative metabolite:H+ symporter